MNSQQLTALFACTSHESWPRAALDFRLKKDTSWAIHERYRTSSHGNAAVRVLRKTDRRALESVSFLPGNGAASALVPHFERGRARANPAWTPVYVAGRGNLLLCCRIRKAAGDSRHYSARRDPLFGASAFFERLGPQPPRPDPKGEILILPRLRLALLLPPAQIRRNPPWGSPCCLPVPRDNVTN